VLAALGVRVKIVTGDNRYVAAHLAQAVGIASARVITGRELGQLRDEALWQSAPDIDVFAEVDPNQKERIILALKKTRHVVGFLGDGINDAPALHAADVGISVDEAVDVAKEAADFVLLERGIGVLRQAVELGRRSFANTLKYLEIITSANFGNMLSMAAASFFLPFLPLLAHQILLNNLLSEVPAMGIAGDAVDAEQLARARRFDVSELRRFMWVFGLISTAFDGLSFAIFWVVTRGAPIPFRTAWFVESLLTELIVLLVLRTRRPCWRSTPGRALWVGSAVVAVLAVALPYAPGAQELLGFVPLSAPLLALTLGISIAYGAATELGKYRYFARYASA
jgi:Mg2+-importing ATPase